MTKISLLICIIYIGVYPDRYTVPCPYCNHLDIDINLYEKILQNILDVKLFDIEIFAEYKKAYENSTEIKNLKLKVSAVNQGDEIRVTGKNIDDLQAIMKHLKSLDFKAPLVFDNFK